MRVFVCVCGYKYKCIIFESLSADTCLHHDDLECDMHVAGVSWGEVEQEGCVPPCGALTGDHRAVVVQVHRHLVTYSYSRKLSHD